MSVLFKQLEEKTEKYNETNDCTVKATAIVMGTTYEDAHNICAKAGRVRRKGTNMFGVITEIEKRGFDVTPVRCHAKTVKTFGRYRIKGVYLIIVNGHVLGVSDGQVHDWTKDRCHRILTLLKVTPVAPVLNENATVSIPKVFKERVTRKSSINWELFDTRNGQTVHQYKRQPKYVKQRWRLKHISVRSDPSSLGNLDIRYVGKEVSK